MIHQKRIKYNRIIIILLIVSALFLTSCQTTEIDQRAEYKYNLTNMANGTTSPVSLVKVVNDELMFGFFGLMLLIVVWIISFISFFNNTGSGIKSLAAACYVGFIIGTFLVALEMLAPFYIFLMIILAGVFTVISKND